MVLWKKSIHHTAIYNFQCLPLHGMKHHLESLEIKREMENGVGPLSIDLPQWATHKDYTSEIILLVSYFMHLKNYSQFK